MAKIASLYSRGIKYKLTIAICLISIIPILACLNYIFPSVFTGFVSKANLPLVILILFFIIVLGIRVIKQIIDPLVALSRDAKLIAGGDIHRRVEIESDDEVGQVGQALNQLTAKIKESMNELKGYGTKTAQINLEIQKRIVAMSGMLQLSDLISRPASLEEIANLCVEKLQGLAGSSLGFFLRIEDGNMALKSAYGMPHGLSASINLSGNSESVEHILKKHTASILDAKNQNASCSALASCLKVNNLLCLPIYLRQKPAGILGVGNREEGFVYTKDDRELLDIFAKQLTIALENDFLLHAVEKLEIRDALTGLYSEEYINGRLDEEIKRAIIYQRPCAFILLAISNFSSYQKAYGQLASEAVLKKVASCLVNSFQGVERAGRFGDYEFAVIAPEINKRQAENLAENLQIRIGQLLKEESKTDMSLSLSAAVAENPLDGISSTELITCARARLSL